MRRRRLISSTRFTTDWQLGHIIPLTHCGLDKIAGRFEEDLVKYKFWRNSFDIWLKTSQKHIPESKPIVRKWAKPCFITDHIAIFFSNLASDVSS